MHGRVQHAFHRAEDVLLLAGAVLTLAGEHLDQVGQELHVGFIALALERVETGRLATFQRQVVAPAGAHEYLRSLVLVEEEDGRRRVVLLHLTQQKVDQRGLAGTGLADHHGVADGLLAQRVLARVGGMEIEEVRLSVGGLQRGDRLAPRVVVLLARGEIVQRRQAEEIQRTDAGDAGTVFPVAGQLGIERRGHGEVFLAGHEPGI